MHECEAMRRGKPHLRGDPISAVDVQCEGGKRVRPFRSEPRLFSLSKGSASSMSSAGLARGAVDALQRFCAPATRQDDRTQERPTMRRLVIAALVAAALVVAGAAGGAAIFRAYPVRTSLLVAMSRNYLRSWSAPKGSVATELNPAYKRPAAAAPSLIPATADAGDGDWPSYNRTLTSERYAPLAEINAETSQQAEGAVHLRHGAVLELRVRPDHGQRRFDRHDHVRHFLPRSGKLRRELAHP